MCTVSCRIGGVAANRFRRAFWSRKPVSPGPTRNSAGEHSDHRGRNGLSQAEPRKLRVDEDQKVNTPRRPRRAGYPCPIGGRGHADHRRV